MNSLVKLFLLFLQDINSVGKLKVRQIYSCHTLNCWVDNDCRFQDVLFDPTKWNEIGFLYFQLSFFCYLFIDVLFLSAFTLFVRTNPKITFRWMHTLYFPDLPLEIAPFLVVIIFSSFTVIIVIWFFCEFYLISAVVFVRYWLRSCRLSNKYLAFLWSTSACCEREQKQNG